MHLNITFWFFHTRDCIHTYVLHQWRLHSTGLAHHDLWSISFTNYIVTSIKNLSLAYQQLSQYAADERYGRIACMIHDGWRRERPWLHMVADSTRVRATSHNRLSHDPWNSAMAWPLSSDSRPIAVMPHRRTSSSELFIRWIVHYIAR